MGWRGIERNKLDYILTDLLPVELSELFSYTQFYNFLSQKNQQKNLNSIITEIKEQKAKNSKIMFQNGWSTKPLKYRILKGTDTMREISVIQPLSALNLFLFVECYQKEILNFFHQHHEFSIRYHKKSTDLYYRNRKGKTIEYFQRQSISTGKNVLQQNGNFFKIGPFESINSFADSRIWRMSNFKFKYYAKMDYKACFDSIYTHAFTWTVERNVVDAKNAHNSNLFITIDRVLQNINGRSSNGVVVGPEFSRMVAELLLQRIDEEIVINLAKDDIIQNKDYKVFRYVDDIFAFANTPTVLDQIQDQYKLVGEKFLLRLNELKFFKGTTPCLPKEWLEKTRELSYTIGRMFFHGSKKEFETLSEDERFLIKGDFVPVDSIKDKISILIKTYANDKRTIISFLLSTILNNISKKSRGYTLLSKKQHNKALLILDLTLYIYAYYPSFDQTRKVISIISFLNSEINFKTDDLMRDKLQKIIHRYSFVFKNGNLHDICDWFPFFNEFGINLDTLTEECIIEKAEKCDDPIIWGNLLIYSRYYTKSFEEMKEKIEAIVHQKIQQISDSEPMMQAEFWYALIFHNCPFLSSKIITEIDSFINNKIQIKKLQGNPSQLLPSAKCTKLVVDFLQRKTNNGVKPKDSFFNWKGSNNFSSEITYRTFQKTLFKHYRKNTHYIYASLN